MADVREYRDVRPEERSYVTFLDAAPCYKPGFNGTEIQLASYTAGYEPAGSMMRYTNAGFAVWWHLDGARRGQRYRTEAEARAHFDRLVNESAAAVNTALASLGCERR